MSKLSFKSIKPASFLLVALMGLIMVSCSQGMGPSAGLDDQGTVVAPEAPGDVCERPEHADNLNCLWVAKNLALTSGGKVDQKIEFSYDENGNINHMKMLDNQSQLIGEGTFYYNEVGPYRAQMFAQPATSGKQDYTVEIQKEFDYQPNSDLIQRTIEKSFTNDILDYTKGESFSYGVDHQIQAWGNTLDNQNVFLEGFVKTIDLDENTGKPLQVDTRKTPTGNMGDYDQWEQLSYEYDLATGRTLTMTERYQDCTAQACDFSQDIDPDWVELTEFRYDAKNRLTGLDKRVQGVLELKCDVTYSEKTQNKIHGTHPIEHFMKYFAPSGLRIGFDTQDRLDLYECSSIGTGAPSSGYGMAIEWVRYYEVVPGAEAPTS